ncbi:MAG: ABC transporter permease [Bacteroidales bacterium]
MILILKLIRESYRFAFQSVVVNKVRTLLSLLGITIGIFSVISVLTIFDSMELAIRKSIQSLGSNVLFVQKWPWGSGGEYPWWKYWQRPEPRLQDMREIERRSQAAEATAFMFEVSRTVKFKANSIENTSVLAVSHDFDNVLPLDIAEGRYFTVQESNGGANVAIVGSEVAKNLFAGLSPLGKEIRVFGNKVRVIGVLKKEGDDMFGMSSDNQVIVPVNFARKYIDTRQVQTTILVKAKEGVSNDELKDELTGILRSVRKLKPKADDDFSINETDIISQNFDSFFGIISLVGWIVGSFSLLVGGFGIANIMFVSVKERTSQIGIQMSLGAKRYFILLQFLFESIFLSLFGGAFGLLLIYVLVLISSGLPFQLVLTFENIVLGMSVSILIGLIAGIVPSYSASRLDPVEAMRTSF